MIALAYLISPIDLIPDLFVPFVGWIDDAFLIGLVIYYLRFNRLPTFSTGNRADRDLAKRYHTDRVANLGKEFQDLANQKLIEIKEAYTIMMEDK